MYTVNIIGCGKLGKTIAKLLTINGCGQILGVINSTFESSMEAAGYVGQGVAFASLKELPMADIYFITTRDGYIKKVCEELVATKTLKRGAIIIHCSGSISSDVLDIAKTHGCLIASVHPVRSFADPDMSVSAFKGTYCAFEGDNEALPCMKKIFEGIGGNIFMIKGENKKLYHSAMVMANNYLVTLHFHATKNLISAGVDDETAKLLISSMMLDALNNLKNLEHKKALTGPIQRGDVETIRGHLASIKEKSIRSIYASLGSGTLLLTNHAPELVNELEDLFVENSEKDVIYSQNKKL